MGVQELVATRIETLKGELREETRRTGYDSLKSRAIRRRIREHLVAQCYLDMVPPDRHEDMEKAQADRRGAY